MQKEIKVATSLYDFHFCALFRKLFPFMQVLNKLDEKNGPISLKTSRKACIRFYLFNHSLTLLVVSPDERLRPQVQIPYKALQFSMLSAM